MDDRYGTAPWITAMKGPLADQGIEGPAYADRVKGRLTFRDWDRWEPADQVEYQDEHERQMEQTRQRMWADMDAGTFSLSDLS